MMGGSVLSLVAASAMVAGRSRGTRNDAPLTKTCSTRPNQMKLSLAIGWRYAVYMELSSGRSRHRMTTAGATTNMPERTIDMPTRISGVASGPLTSMYWLHLSSPSLYLTTQFSYSSSNTFGATTRLSMPVWRCLLATAFVNWPRHSMNDTLEPMRSGVPMTAGTPARSSAIVCDSAWLLLALLYASLFFVVALALLVSETVDAMIWMSERVQNRVVKVETTISHLSSLYDSHNQRYSSMIECRHNPNTR